jgi:uncharacterized protein YqjF (DUF2071 family)
MPVRPLTATLRDVWFLHWPVPAATVDRATPAWLTPDTADDTAWASALVLTARRVSAAGVGLRENVGALVFRTYVRDGDDRRGVHFLSVHVDDGLIAAGADLSGLPCHEADVDRESTGDGHLDAVRRPAGAGVDRAVQRLGDAIRGSGRERGVTADRREEALLTATVEPAGEPREPGPDTLPAFLVERSRYFATGPLGTPLVGGVGHDPWRISPASATVDATGLFAAAGLEAPADDPLAHHSPGLEMALGAARPQ